MTGEVKETTVNCSFCCEDWGVGVGVGVGEGDGACPIRGRLLSVTVGSNGVGVGEEVGEAGSGVIVGVTIKDGAGELIGAFTGILLVVDFGVGVLVGLWFCKFCTI